MLTACWAAQGLPCWTPARWTCMDVLLRLRFAARADLAAKAHAPSPVLDVPDVAEESAGPWRVRDPTS